LVGIDRMERKRGKQRKRGDRSSFALFFAGKGKTTRGGKGTTFRIAHLIGRRKRGGEKRKGKGEVSDRFCPFCPPPQGEGKKKKKKGERERLDL